MWMLAALVEVVASISVWPSGAEPLTDRTPTMPLAPGLLSTTKGWPVFSSMYLPTRRAVMSPEPPGAKGTMMWTGLVGQSVATAFCAASRDAGSNAAAKAPSALRRPKVGLDICSPVRSPDREVSVSTSTKAWPASYFKSRQGTSGDRQQHGPVRTSTARRHPCCRFHPRHRRSHVHPDPGG